MTWTPYTPRRPGKKPAPSPVALTVPPAKSSASPILMIDDATLQRLGWKSSQMLTLLVGGGEDQGKIRIVPDANGPVGLVKPSGAHYKRMRIRLGRMPCFSDETYRGAVQFAIANSAAGSELTITVPDEVLAHQLPRRTAAAVRLAAGR